LIPYITALSSLVAERSPVITEQVRLNPTLGSC